MSPNESTPDSARVICDSTTLRIGSRNCQQSGPMSPLHLVKPKFREACARCSLLRPDPAQRARLDAIRDNLEARIIEAKREGWLGEVGPPGQLHRRQGQAGPDRRHASAKDGSDRTRHAFVRVHIRKGLCPMRIKFKEACVRCSLLRPDPRTTRQARRSATTGVPH